MLDIIAFKLDLQGKIIVSIQPIPDSPLDNTAIIVAMAMAAQNAGAPALRIEGVANVAAVVAAVNIPIIAIVKRDFDNSQVRISPLLEDVAALAAAGASVIAFDPTDRIRPVARLDILQAIKNANCLAMADCSCFDDGIWAHAHGADIIGTTLSGYTQMPIPQLPDFDLVSAFAKQGFFVMAEGRYNTPEMAAKAISLGATAVTIGSAITRLEVVTNWFLEATKAAFNK